MATTKEKKRYLKQLKAYRKKHGTLKGAPKFGRYMQERETGSKQHKAGMRSLSSGDYAAIKKRFGKKKRKGGY